MPPATAITPSDSSLSVCGARRRMFRNWKRKGARPGSAFSKAATFSGPMRSTSGFTNEAADPNEVARSMAICRRSSPAGTRVSASALRPA